MSRLLRLRGWCLALAAAVLTGSATAQSFSTERTCGTPTPTTSEVLASVVQVEGWLAANPDVVARQRGTVVTIPVAMHLINSGPSVAQGNVPDAWVIDQMEGLNDAYRSMGLQFVLAVQQRVTNADWADLSQGGADEIAMKQALHLDVARYLNMYFTPRITSPQGDLLGFATFPDGQAESNFRQGVVNVSDSMPGGSPPYDDGDTATHEVGHYVGLYHTFQGGCSASGDGVNDTPAEASPNFTGCSLTRDTCPSQPGFDPVQNFMDYSVDSCLIEFTPGQYTRSLALMNLYRPTIMGQAGAFLATPSLAFGDQYVGSFTTQTIRVLNLDAEPIEITGVTSSSAAVTVSPSITTIPVGGSVDLEVTFAPFEPGPVAATLTIATSAEASPTLVVSVGGTAIQAASASFSSVAFSSAAPVGATATETLTLSNGGPAILDYTFGGGARLASPDVFVPGSSTARADGGGPDAFGYSWQDSNQAGGPVFDWVDIATSGTAVTLTSNDAATVDLPFAFPYYGTDRTSVRIVSNGWLGFAGSGSSTSPFNTALPSSMVPSDLIAPFWDNLNPATGGEVRYQDMGDGRFVVSWIGVPPNSGTGTYTFQAILYDDGRIRFQYQTMDAGLTTATVGIENATGTTGLQVAFNEPYITDGLAVDVQVVPTWLTVAPLSGTVAVGGSQDVTLTLDATDLAAGAYQDLLELTTNDPTVPQPTRIHVVFAVGGTLAPPAIATPLYGAVGVPTTVPLGWTAATGATEYEWEVASDSLFTTTVTAGSTGAESAWITLGGGTRYFWRVRSLDGVLPSAWTVPFAFTTEGVVAGEVGTERTHLALGAVYPNPTRGALTVPFSLATADAGVTVRVLDVTGREVAVIADAAPFAAGSHRIEWDATGFPAGLYLVQLQAGGQVQTGRVTLLR